MDVAAFVLSILALLFALLGLGLSMRALYIIGVNSGLAKPQENKEKTTIQTPKKFTPKKNRGTFFFWRRPLRVTAGLDESTVILFVIFFVNFFVNLVA